MSESKNTVKEKISENIVSLIFTALPYENFMTGFHMGWLIPLISIVLFICGLLVVYK